METVLFLCTGNYYRSRFAEEYFNALAIKSDLPWRADSRGLRQNMSTLYNVGPMSRDAIAKLKKLGIKPRTSERYPLPVTIRDFQSADRIIALCESEHRPMMRELFPMFEASIEYWDVEDLPFVDAETGLSQIQNHVDLLAQTLTEATFSSQK